MIEDRFSWNQCSIRVEIMCGPWDDSLSLNSVDLNSYESSWNMKSLPHDALPEFSVATLIQGTGEFTMLQPRDDHHDIEFSVDWFHKWIAAIKEKLLNSMPSQMDVSYRWLWKDLTTWNYMFVGHSQNEFIILSLSGMHVERISSADINPVSFHLTAFKLMIP